MAGSAESPLLPWGIRSSLGRTSGLSRPRAVGAPLIRISAATSGKHSLISHAFPGHIRTISSRDEILRPFPRLPVPHRLLRSSSHGDSRLFLPVSSVRQRPGRGRTRGKPPPWSALVCAFGSVRLHNWGISARIRRREAGRGGYPQGVRRCPIRKAEEADRKTIG